MNKTVIEVQVRAVLPTSGGCAVFIGNNDKVFIIYVDQTVGSAITMFMRDITKERPLTHDLLANVIEELGGTIEFIEINDLQAHTFFARINIKQNGNMISIDSRPSDAIALAVTANVPIYVAEDVLDEVCGE